MNENKNNMKRIFKSLLLSIGLVCLSFTLNAQIPNVKVENLQGNVINSSSLVDNQTPMIISFWSTTCKPCMRELDAISELMPEWLEEVNFRVVAVSVDDSRSVARARALTEGRGWDDFVLIFDKNQEFMRAMNVTLTPQVYVADKNGKIVYSHTGYAPGNEMELYDELLKLKE